jgi:hypothetical protein
MSREWLAVYTAMATKPKYRRLSPMGRGGLLHVLMLAGFQSPEATWDDADELRESLLLEAFPPGIYEELLGLGWLETLDEGGVAVRDWDEHQQAVTSEIRRTWEAARKREWRKKKRRRADASPSPTPPTPREQKNRGEEKGPGHVRDMSGTSTPPDDLNPCPRCGASVRFYEESKRGPFYGCTSYPKCEWSSDEPPKPPLYDLNSDENRQLRGAAR